MGNFDKIVNLCKNRGIIFQGSDIYDGLANTWDYGPVGVELKNNIKRTWWKKFVQESANSFGVDADILMHPKVWEASGHVEGFNDPKIDCKNCKTRYGADHLIEDFSKDKVNADIMSFAEMEQYIAEHKVPCPKCGKSNWTNIKTFNMMFSTSRGLTDENQNLIYLRPETAQGEFVNFLNVQRSMRAKLPFGIAQIGKAFRNEVTPGNFTFRTIEFEQMEHQWFCKPEDSMNFYEEFKQKAVDYLVSIGFKRENLRYHDHDKLAFYAKAACDVYYNFPIGWKELNGVHHRGDWDLSRHQEFSGKSMIYTDPFTNEKYIPNVIEYSIGADRLTLAVLCEAYDEEKLPDGDTRVVLHFHPAIAPYKVAILPLQKNLGDKAREVYNALAKNFMVTYDDAGSIGKRYRRQDEIGTPMCITIDFDTLNDNTVTIRDRDTMEQIRLNINGLKDYISKKIEY